MQLGRYVLAGRGAGLGVDLRAMPIATGVSAAKPPAALPMPHVDGVEHRFVRIDRGEFHIATTGDGAPLVLLHGWPQHWWSWRRVLPSLARHYRVICPDIRGLGWSRGFAGRYGWDDLADDLIALIDSLGFERVRLVGHDWGLVTGYRACLLYPERFERFVALGGIHPWQLRQIRPIAIRRPWHIWAQAALGRHAFTGLNIAERALRKWRHVGSFTADEMTIYLSAIHQPSAVEASVRFNRNVVMRELPRAAIQQRRWRLRVPTLHLLGAHDPITPFVPHSYRRYAHEMSLETMAGCGHFIPEEAPEPLLERLDRFL